MLDTSPFLVLLVDTNPPGLSGSMKRYATLTELALAKTLEGNSGIRIARLSVACPITIPAWVPQRLHTWINHCWLLLMGRRKISRSKADLIHLLDGSYGYVLAKEDPEKCIATVHDLIPLLQEAGTHQPKSVSAFAKKILSITHHTLRECKGLIADSSNTMNDLVDLLRVDKNKIKVVHPPLDPEILRSGQEFIRTRHSATAEAIPMVLHVGNNAWYKNREGVLRVFARVRRSLPARLIMAGAEPTTELHSLVRSLSLEDDVTFQANPNDDTLIELYGNATVFLFPSLYEGFGWPPLEAMACGCPVVSATDGSLSQVVGNAGLSAPAEDEEALARMCIDVLSSPELAQGLSVKGVERCGDFSLEQMGKQLLRVYLDALGLSSPAVSADLVPEVSA